MEKEVKEKDWRPIWLFLIINVVAIVILSVASNIISNTKGVALEEVVNTGSAYATIGIDIVLLLILLTIYGKRICEALKKLTKKHIILIIVSAILVISINDIISNLFEVLNVEMTNQETVTKFLEMYEIPMLLVTVICAPIIEELVFRYSLGTICKNKVVFVIVSGLLFGFAHGVGIASILYIYIGVSLAIIYLKSDKNIMVPITVHFLNNLVSVLMYLLIN